LTILTIWSLSKANFGGFGQFGPFVAPLSRQVANYRYLRTKVSIGPLVDTGTFIVFVCKQTKIKVISEDDDRKKSFKIKTFFNFYFIFLHQLDSFAVCTP
jgi:hypothetical protein